jgi:hypothetical protein
VDERCLMQRHRTRARLGVRLRRRRGGIRSFMADLSYGLAPLFVNRGARRPWRRGVRPGARDYRPIILTMVDLPETLGLPGCPLRGLRSYPPNLSGSCQRREQLLNVLRDQTVEDLLAALHARSDEQAALERNFYDQRIAGAQAPTPHEIKTFRSDKLVALDRDKGEFCYQLCRANDARRVVEVGSSYGVSTLYLAAAVRDNVRASGGEGVVIGTKSCATRFGPA